MTSPVSAPGGPASYRAGRRSASLSPALVAQPQVLFADEPTGSLDSVAGRMVMDLLTGIARQEGTTVVFVTHDPRVAAYADREVTVSDGRVATSVGGSARAVR